jgi:hypothetical protein
VKIASTSSHHHHQTLYSVIQESSWSNGICSGTV